MSELAKYINELAGDYVENWVGEQLADEWQNDKDKIERLQARVDALESVRKAADRVEKGHFFNEGGIIPESDWLALMNVLAATEQEKQE